MKTNLRLLVLLGFFVTLPGINSFSQVLISNDNSTADASAMLEVRSTEKGLLLPRMTRTELYAISSPADGLLVYCTDCGLNGLGALSMFISGAWFTLTVNCLSPLSPLSGTHVPSGTQIVWNWNPVTGAIGYKWNTVNDYGSATDRGTSTTNTETGLTCNTLYTRYVWAYNSCGNSIPTTLTQTTSSSAPAAPSAGTHVPSGTQIVWNWNSVSGATGYKWSTINDYSSAEDMGTNVTKTETGLTPGATYTRYVWAYNACGISSVTTLSRILLYIGQSFGGGIVFYIDGSGQHGLIAATSDQGYLEYGCRGTSVGSTAVAIGTGQANTAAIVSGCSTSSIAAKICDDLDLNGYTDWFLPSKDELNQMRLHYTVIGGFFLYNYYWSSSEMVVSPYNNAWAQQMFTGDQSGDMKDFINSFRAIRAF